MNEYSCMTCIELYTTDKNELKHFFTKLNEWTSHNTRTNDFGKMWLGNIILNSGLSKSLDGYPCDGYIDSMDFDGSIADGIFLDVRTKDLPHLKMWMDLLNIWCPSGSVLIYTADKDDANLHCTNDDEVAKFSHFEDSGLPDYQYVEESNWK